MENGPSKVGKEIWSKSIEFLYKSLCKGGFLSEMQYNWTIFGQFWDTFAYFGGTVLHDQRSDFLK